MSDVFDGAVSRDQLARIGVDARIIRREVAAERWAVHGRQTIATHTGPLSAHARRCRGVWETGVNVAVLDGATALIAAGLSGFEEQVVHLSVVHTAKVRDTDGVRIHKIVRRVEDELVGSGLPRARPAVAAIRAAHWAVSDRQAALLLAMPVQQRLVTPAQLIAALDTVRGRTRRQFVHQVVADVADGAHSLGELDVTRALRQRGMPHPTHQVVRQGHRGRAYLDLGWEDAHDGPGLLVEVDGSGHLDGLATADDQLRQNAVTIGGDVVLRVTLIGFRVHREVFLDQVTTAYRQWRSRGGRPRSRYSQTMRRSANTSNHAVRGG